MLKIFSRFKSKKEKATNISVFLLKAELSFQTIAQVSYINEKGQVKIVRFNGDSWKREIPNCTNNLEDINLKLFVHRPNNSSEESVKLSIEYREKVIISQKFIIKKNKDFAGWFKLLPLQQFNLFDDYLK